MRIGMAGIGLMGHGIATNLQKHGHALVLLDHPGNQPLDALVAGGATTVASGRALAEACELVILVVTGSPQVEAVLAGPGGVLEGLRPGTVVIDCSTSMPDSTRRMAQAVQAAGGHFLDTPMTRTPREAAEGRLNLLAGGDADLLERCRPVLQCFAEHVTHMGPTGAGHATKLLHNFVSLGMVTLVAEAAACATRSGVALDAFTDVLARGGGGGIALERLRPYLLAGDVGGLRFSIANARKDLGYYEAMAQAAGARCGVASAVRTTLDDAAGTAAPDALMPELVSLLARS